MTTLNTPATRDKKSFNVITESFLQSEGLPFASVLDAQSIQQAFVDQDALFAQQDLFSTEIVLWAFFSSNLARR